MRIYVTNIFYFKGIWGNKNNCHIQLYRMGVLMIQKKNLTILLVKKLFKLIYKARTPLMTIVNIEKPTFFERQSTRVTRQRYINYDELSSANSKSNSVIRRSVTVSFIKLSGLKSVKIVTEFFCLR